MLRTLTVLSPFEQYPELTKGQCCLKEGCDGELSSNGWTSSETELPRVIFAATGEEYVLVRSYKCKRCQTRWAASNPKLFASLPQAIQDSYGIILTRRGGVTAEMISSMMGVYHGGLPFERMAEDRNSRSRERYLQMVNGYVLRLAARKGSSFRDGVAIDVETVARFGAYDDEDKYGGRYISPRRFASLYKLFHAARRDLIDRKMQSQSADGCAVSFEDTFKLTNKLRPDGDERAYSCFQSVKSSAGLTLLYRVSETKGASSALRALRGLGNRLKDHGRFHSIYTDQCCTDRPVFLEAFPWLLETESNPGLTLPPLERKSAMIYVDTYEGISPALEQLRRSCDFAEGLLVANETRTIIWEKGASAVGLDVEWTPAFSTGGRGRGIIGVMQFSTTSVTVVIDLAKILKLRSTTTISEATLRFPRNLAYFLSQDCGEVEKIYFVGVCVKADASLIFTDFGVSVKRVIDLRAQYKATGTWEHAGRGTLEKLVSVILHKSMPCKSSTVQKSNWSDGLHTKEQCDYAAMDAWASIVAFNGINKSFSDGLKCGGGPNEFSIAEAHPIENRSAVVEPTVQESREQSLQKAERCTAVKLDIFHFMQRLLEQVRGGASKPLGRLFAVMLQVAIFEECDEDRAAIQRTAVDGGACASLARKLPRIAYKRRIRRRVPVPSVLRRRVTAVIDVFKRMKDQANTNLPFFKASIDETVTNALKHVDCGCLSDLEGLGMYYGKVGDVIKCVRGSSSLEAFHRHLRAALPGFAYGAELFDAVIAEYLFCTNARASARLTDSHPISVSELCAYERLNESCKTLGFKVPKGIAPHFRPLPPNNGEQFGLENLGNWARDAQKFEDEFDESERTAQYSVANVHLDTNNDVYSQSRFTAETDLKGPEEEQKLLKALNANYYKTVSATLQNLRGTGVPSASFMKAVNGGYYVRPPQTVAEFVLLKKATEEEKTSREAKIGRPRKKPDVEQITVNFNKLVEHRNRKAIKLGGSERQFSYATKKQIEGALHRLEENKTAEEIATSGAGSERLEATKVVRRQLSLAVSSDQLPWPSPGNRQEALPEPFSRSETGNFQTQTEIMIGPDPGTYYSAQLPPQERRKAGRCATNALRINECNDVEKSKYVSGKASGILKPNNQSRGMLPRRKVAICKACDVIEGKIVKMLRHGKRCKNRSEYLARKRERKV